MTDSTSPSNNVRQMLSLVEKYGSCFPCRSQAHLNPTALPRYNECVLLTGSTGSLGTYILATLISEPQVKKVFAFNRPSKTSSLLERQMASLVDHGLEAQLAMHHKVVLLEGVASEPKLGLSETVYQELRTTVTAVIHSAWPVGFNRPLLAFEPNIAGTAKLIELALESSNEVQFLFTSSLAPVANWKGEEAIPERSHDASAARTGYGESKWVVEQILARLSDQRGLPTTSFRMCQFAGSTVNGAWNMSEWIPRVIQTGYRMGKMPLVGDGETLSWVPVDIIAAMIVEVLPQPTQGSRVLSLTHPSPSLWNTIMHYAGDYITRSGHPVQYLPFDLWLPELERLSSTPSAASVYPALKLTEFLRINNSIPSSNSVEAMGIPVLGSEEIRKVSRIFRELPKLTRDDVERWMTYWERRGMFAERAAEKPVQSRL